MPEPPDQVHSPERSIYHRPARVLVAWGTRLGGTEGVGWLIAARLQKRGFLVTARPVEAVENLERFDAVVIGSGLYANRWTGSARRFVKRYLSELRQVPVWFFSSGPLDDSASRREIPPTNEVHELMRRVGALDHVTFGGRLEPDPDHFLARAMAKSKVGDWRDPHQIRRWADAIAEALPEASPGEPEQRSEAGRVIGYGLAGAAGCAVILLVAPYLGPTLAQVLHVLLAPAIFVVVSRYYFRPPGTREPIPAASGFTLLVAVVELALIDLRVTPAAWLWSLLGFWTTLALIFFATWATGNLMATLPWSQPEVASRPTPPPSKSKRGPPPRPRARARRRYGVTP